MSAPYSDNNPYKRIVQLLDVKAESPSNGDVLEYSSTDGLWHSKPNNPAVVNAQTIDVTNNATFPSNFCNGVWCK